VLTHLVVVFFASLSNAKQPNSQTAEQPNSRTAEQPNSQTAKQPNSRIPLDRKRGTLERAANENEDQKFKALPLSFGHSPGGRKKKGSRKALKRPRSSKRCKVYPYPQCQQKKRSEAV
jgi:hypothetical protein